MHTPDFVATIDGAPAAEDLAFPPTAEALAPAVAPTKELSPVAPQRPGRRRPPRVMSRVLLAAVAAAIALYAAGVGGNLLGMVRNGAAARVVPSEGGSLLRTVALEAALHGLPQGRVEGLRVAADRIDARVVVDGRVRLVSITSRGRVTDLPANDEPTGTTVRVDARAPARFVHTVTRRTGRGPANVSHLLLEGARWQLLLEDGRQYSADAHGRAVRRG
jgi:hypothetical protein